MNGVEIDDDTNSDGNTNDGRRRQITTEKQKATNTPRDLQFNLQSFVN